ncbi:hypothetical protein Mapa_000319 [Marchantia paleacea]|nr:hypothetical protein Mapa_000319 [Marchantia paleacea]
MTEFLSRQSIHILKLRCQETRGRNQDAVETLSLISERTPDLWRTKREESQKLNTGPEQNNRKPRGLIYRSQIYTTITSAENAACSITS